MSRQRIIGLFIAFGLFSTSVGPNIALALNPQKAITQYGQSIWTIKEGLPQNAVNRILQTWKE